MQPLRLLVLGLLAMTACSSVASADFVGAGVGDARGDWLAVSATGDASCSGTSPTCVAVSGTGDAHADTLAVSGTGDTRGLVAVSAGGHATSSFTGLPLAVSPCDASGMC
ncbi:MAG: hypothetical protein LC624_03060 [Halobacteriales archaeon]|nr:hypothetical protein [Halobacteriales archaeon]